MSLTIQANNDLADFTVDIPLRAMEARKDALEMSASVTAIENDAQLNDCVAAASLVHSLVKGIKSAYDEAKAPILLATKRLDTVHHGYADALALEKKRLDALATAYVTKRDAAARQAREQAEAELTAKTEAAAAAGASSDELRELAMQRQELAQLPGVAGALARQTWDYEVLDLGVLWQTRPDLVELTPRRALVLEAIKGGTCLPGLRVYAETKVRARA